MSSSCPCSCTASLRPGAPGPSCAAAAPRPWQRGSSRASVRPDFGPRGLHPTAGAVLVAARPPLVAFNVELAQPATLEDARSIAALIREGGPEGLESVRAIGLWLDARGLAQVSTNVEDHRAVPLARVVEAIARHARPIGAELVGLAPRAAFDGFPEDLPIRRRLEDRWRDGLEARPSRRSDRLPMLRIRGGFARLRPRPCQPRPH